MQRSRALPLRKPLPSNETFRLDPYLKKHLTIRRLIALEEEFGVSAAAMAAPAAGAAAPAAEEKTDFNVVLTGFDAAQKIKVIKVIREVMGLGLAEAKAAVEGAPTTMKEGLSKEDAEALKKQVEEVGGKVELK